MIRSRIFFVLAAVAAGCLAGAAHAGTTSWTFDVSTSGEDVAWTSPTSVDPSASAYAITSNITTIEVDVLYLGLPFGPIDVTDQVPPEFLSASDTVPGPAPIVFIEDAIVFPEPPEAPAVQGDLEIGIDATGFGYASLTNVTLGSLSVDLGFPFGVVTVDLTNVRIVGDVTVDPIVLPEDLTGDGVVNSDDLFQLLGAWGACAGCPEDLTGDGLVNSDDLFQLLGAWG